MHRRVSINQEDHIALKATARSNGERFQDAQARTVARLVEHFSGSPEAIAARLQQVRLGSVVWQGWFIEDHTWEQFRALRRRTGIPVKYLLHLAVKMELTQQSEKASHEPCLVSA